MSQPCSEQDPESLAGADIADDWDIGVDEGDGGWFDKALDAHDRQQEVADGNAGAVPGRSAL